MPQKKHCSRHYRYVATCPDCRRLNDEDPNQPVDEVRYYTDVDLDDLDDLSHEPSDAPTTNVEIPHSDSVDLHSYMGRRSTLGGGASRPSGRGGSGSGSGGSIPPRRFQYNRPMQPNHKRTLIIIISIFVIIGAIMAIYAIPLWHAKISLQEQLYSNKSDVDFWEIYTLNYWSTNFMLNKIGLIGGLMGAIVMTLPPEKNFLTLLGTKFGWGRPSTKKSVIFWWTIGFVFFYFIGQSIDKGNFALAMYMSEKGTLHIGLDNALNAFSNLKDPASVSMTDMFIYTSVVHPLISFFLGLVLTRVIFNTLTYLYLIKDSYRVLANGCFMLGLFFLMGLFGMVENELNGIDLIRVYSSYIAIIAFFSAGIGLIVMGNKKNSQNIYVFDNEARRKTVVSAITIIIVILIPIFISIPNQIGVDSDPNIWRSLEWDYKIQREISWTRQAAGIEIGNDQIFAINDITNYTTGVSTSDSLMIENIRQYDKNVSAKLMVKDIKTTFETMADSDIVYVNNGTFQGEYWVAPRTLQTSILQQSSVNLHTELYDHVNGFIALDTSTGQTLARDEYYAIFGVDNNYPIFFGEGEDTSYQGSSDYFDLNIGGFKAYQNDILLYTGWASNGSQYSGAPDGNLTGLEAFWFTMDMGLTNFALNGEEKSYLINRNIKDRVNAVLLPGLKIDNDPYLVFNREEHKIYYALSIYTSINIGAYAKAPLYRLIGVVLVDVLDGSLNWYINPSLPLIQDDPLSAIWKIYTNTDLYPWKAAPSWLISQLRYSEELWEKQLSVDYKYHVLDSETWKKGNDFFERPAQGDVFYIETDLGNGLEYVGVDMVEYIGQGALKLAGLYVLRQGMHFGEVIFYRANDSQYNLIGPETARLQLATEATQEISLISNPRFGNKLLYPLAGSLYYYIPVYSQVSDYEVLSLAGLVNAFTKETYYGANVHEAYQQLSLNLLTNTTTIENVSTATEFNLQVDNPGEINYTIGDWADFRTLVEVISENESLGQLDLTLNLTIRSDVPINIKLFTNNLTGVPFNLTDGIEAENYTLAEWSGANGLYPGEGRIITFKMSPAEQFNAPQLVVGWKVDLIFDGKIVASTSWQVVVFINQD